MPSSDDIHLGAHAPLKRARVVSGMRPTGALHLGHYHGVLKNWLALQQQHDCLFFVADYHALTTQQQPDKLAGYTLDVLIDWLSVGLDPEQVTLFVQSAVPAHAELQLLLAMVCPGPWLERMPSYKDMQSKLGAESEGLSYGFLGYPLLQAADVLLYQAEWVPVGEDQVPHIEFAREIARRFNFVFGGGVSGGAVQPQRLLSEPQALLTEAAKLPGMDGQKMSKSYNNTVPLRATAQEVSQAIRTMTTDPARVRRSDAGEPERCPVWAFHQVYSSEVQRQELAAGCRSASIGCVDCKRPLIEAINQELDPIRQRSAHWLSHPDQVTELVQAGVSQARHRAESTIAVVQQAVGFFRP